MIPTSVLNYFQKNTGIPDDRCISLFAQLEEFLAESSSTAPIVPTKEIDEAWHAFILHTQEYAAYCLNRFGKFIHHRPFDILDEDKRLASCNSACSSNCERG